MNRIYRFTLGNGLRVVHCHDPHTAMVAVDVMYDVGSRDESRDLTGMAHLFEHLMFGGSANEPDFNGAIERAGGVNNAWTSPDFTNFYEVLPAQNLEAALRVESDRMLALSFNPQVLEVQRSVVIEEFKETVLNRPYGHAMHDIRAMLYHPAHPYSWPVIGLTPDHIERVTDSDVRNWFYSHYAPNNAVLAVAGNIEPERLRELVEKWFDDIPRREIAQRRMPQPVFHTADDTHGIWREVTDRVPSPHIILAWPMAAYGGPGYTEADLITDLLSSGKASRLRQNLVAQHPELLSDAEASIIGSEHEGLLLIDCRVNDNLDDSIARSREYLLKEAYALTEPSSITLREMQRAINRFEASHAAAAMSPVSMARRLAAAEMHGEDPDTELRRRRSVTIDDVAYCARCVFENPAMATLVIKPEN